MKKCILVYCAVPAIIFLACENHTANKTVTAKSHDTSFVKQNTDTTHRAEIWLKSIFKCANAKGFCYYIDREDTLYTKRFSSFLSDANEVYGPTNLSGAAIAIAEKKYKAKWSKIYPLYTAEMRLFGRGQDDNEHLNNVAITGISPLKYKVIIDYCYGYTTKNIVTLVTVNNSFKIDYCKTNFIK